MAQSEITMDYVNLSDGSARSNALGRTAAVSGRNLVRLVAVSFGLLCVLQAALNISLRLALYNKTPDIEASCTNLTDELKRELINFDQYFQQGWVYFRPSLYYISSDTKSWQESRAYCLQRGADLVIINSKEEQDFTRIFHKQTWIGLMFRGTWKWVDGTPLTKSYWGPGEPNGFEDRNEDCVKIKFYEQENSWNDIQCGDQNFWICEKRIAS
ncbi:C-type lectin domain family 17, member A-like isoform X1 [Sebastes fasciatus]|uniref:C-type lectin domain family 17, member A-like isoform X1 n=1 Tax=Sebastes fasciatus TaxID=394691 RepID=UPI003D9F1BE5